MTEFLDYMILLAVVGVGFVKWGCTDRGDHATLVKYFTGICFFFKKLNVFFKEGVRRLNRAFGSSHSTSSAYQKWPTGRPHS